MNEHNKKWLEILEYDFMFSIYLTEWQNNDLSLCEKYFKMNDIMFLLNKTRYRLSLFNVKNNLG